jgi:hypothetical protein
MQNLIKTISNRYFKNMVDKRFHIYLTENRINICWIRSSSNANNNDFKTYKYNSADMKNLVNWVVVKTGFPQAKNNVKIEAPFNNHKDLIHLLEGYNIKIIVK